MSEYSIAMYRISPFCVYYCYLYWLCQRVRFPFFVSYLMTCNSSIRLILPLQPPIQRKIHGDKASKSSNAV